MTIRHARKRIPCRILAAVALFAGATLAAGPSAGSAGFPESDSARPEALVIGKGKEKSRVPFQASGSKGCGNGFTSCTVELYTVPRKRRLEVRNVSCLFTLRAPGSVTNAAAVFVNSQTGTFDTMLPVKIREAGGFQTFGFNTQTFVFGNAGDALIVGVGTDNDISNLNCKVAGELIKLK